MTDKEFDAWLANLDVCRKAWTELAPEIKERAESFWMRVYLPSGETKLPMLSIVSCDFSPDGTFDQYLEDVVVAGLAFFDAELDDDPEFPEVIRLRNKDRIDKAIANGVFPYVDDGLMYMAIDDAFVV